MDINYVLPGKITKRRNATVVDDGPLHLAIKLDKACQTDMFIQSLNYKRPRKRKPSRIPQPDELSPKKLRSHTSSVKEEDTFADDCTLSPKSLSKRQIKKEKGEQREAEKKNTNKQNIMCKALDYVSKWKYKRREWRFEKLKQIWLIDNLLDENCIPDAIFPDVLEYFQGCKGMAREVLLKKGMTMIKKAEDNNVETKDEVMKSIAYQRARQLLQILPTEM